MKYDFETLIDRLEQGSSKWAGMKRKKPDVPPGTVPFSTADMEFKNAPEIIEGLKSYLDTHVLGYTGTTDAYFEAVCSWMKKRHNWEIAPESIVPTTGVVPALVLAVEAFAKPGEGVIVMPPVYGPFYRAIEGHGCETVRCTLIYEQNNYRIDYDLLEKLAAEPNNTLMLFCSPHNPGGRVWTREELKKVGEICSRNGVKIVSDEIHGDLIMPGHTHIPFPTAVDDPENIVVCTAPSKTFNLAAMSTSNIILSKQEDREAFQAVMQKNHSARPTALGMEACRTAYTQCEAWLEECISVVYDNYRMAVDYIHQYIPEIKPIEMEGTYLLWLDCTALGKTAEELSELMIAHDLFFNEGTFFGPEGAGFERFNLAAPKRVIMGGLERLRTAVESVR